MLGEVRKVKIMGTRRAIQDALGYAHNSTNILAEYLDYLTKIEKTHHLNTYQNVLAIQFAKISDAVNSQKPHIAAWLHFAYGPDIDEESAKKQRQMAMVAQTITATLAKPVCSIKRRDRLHRLCGLAVEDYRAGLFLGKTLPDVLYSEVIDVSPTHFVRDWGKDKTAALELVKKYDSEGVAGVSETVKAIREAENDS